MDIERVEKVRTGLHDSFSGIDRGVCDTIAEFSKFITMMDPFVDYFFSGGKNARNFINEVVAPSENDLSKALSGALNIVDNDLSVHGQVHDALIRVLSLQDSVEKIVAMLDAIETYSLNTIIMSAKAGTEGQALAAISGEMTRMSQLGSSLSLAVTDKMGSLVESLDRFAVMRDEIEALHENKLTMIQISSQTLFKKLKTEFVRLSGDVHGEYAMLFSVQESLKKVTEKFQHEDIVRQNMEKVVFSLTEEREFEVKNLQGKGFDRELFTVLADEKLAEMHGRIGLLRSEMESALGEFELVVNVFSGLIASENEGKSPDDRADVLVELSSRFDTLKLSFEEYIRTILEKKELMYEFLVQLEKDISEFTVFFKGIVDISKKFKNIILLTTIELSRHDDLKLLLQGTLSDVRVLPDKINTVVMQGEEQYTELITSFRDSLRLYHDRFAEQRSVLEQSSVLIRKVSFQIFESKKYHDDFLKESDLKIEGVRTLVANVRSLLDDLSGFGNVINVELISGKVPDRDLLRQKYGDQLENMSGFYGNAASSGDYRSMMLSSLASEFRSAESAESSIEFF